MKASQNNRWGALEKWVAILLVLQSHRIWAASVPTSPALESTAKRPSSVRQFHPVGAGADTEPVLCCESRALIFPGWVSGQCCGDASLQSSSGWRGRQSSGTGIGCQRIHSSTRLLGRRTSQLSNPAGTTDTNGLPSQNPSRPGASCRAEPGSQTRGPSEWPSVGEFHTT